MKIKNLLVILSLCVLFTGCATFDEETNYEYTIRTAKDQFTTEPGNMGRYSRTAWWKEYERIANEMGSKGWRLIEIMKADDTDGTLDFGDGDTLHTTSTTYHLYFERSLKQTR